MQVTQVQCIVGPALKQDSVFAPVVQHESVLAGVHALYANLATHTILHPRGVAQHLRKIGAAAPPRMDGVGRIAQAGVGGKCSASTQGRCCARCTLERSQTCRWTRRRTLACRRNRGSLASQ